MAQRSRGRKRNQRTRLQPHNATKGADTSQESEASKAYTQGRSVKYKWRIAGPVGKVTTTNIND